MNKWRKKVISVEPITTERKIKHEVKEYKNHSKLEVITIERITKMHVFLECGHARKQENGMRDITNAKELDCFECQINDYENNH